MGRTGLEFGAASKRILSRGGAILLLGLALGASAIAQERTMIIVDGSGSMWGQIEGVPKLTIARQTLREVLQGVPPTTELGLMSYGHREKGNCGDIEIIVPPAAGTSALIANEVDNLNFLGKTPLGDAVQMAAEELRFTEDKANVVLITDGIETCGANICAIANALESGGIDFTAHVVGFGLSQKEGEQISCLATNTGGEFFLANDASSLVAALNEVVAAPLPLITLMARDQEENIVDDVPLNWEVRDAGGDVVAQADDASSIAEAFEAGDYTILVSGEGVSGGMEFSIGEDMGGQTLYVPVERNILTASLEAPAEVAAGADIEVVWDGPNDSGDYITIVEIGTREGGFGNYAYTQNGQPAVFAALDGIGTYELRYVHGPTDKTLATRQIEIVQVSGTLEAPKNVGAGGSIEVVWTGPDNRSDYITIVEVGAEEGEFMDYAYTRNGSPATINAPDVPGIYELRYVLNQSDRTLVSRPISVVGVEGTLEAPDSVAGGAEFEVVWTGPDNRSDFITIVKAGAEEGAYLDYAYTQNGSPAKITAPDDVGTYEIRYVMNQSDRTLASRNIEVTAISGSVKIINNPVPGGVVEVEWSGPDNRSDFITIVEAGAPEGDYGDYAYTQRGSPVVLDVPRALGAFEVRYVLNQSDRTLASAPLVLRPAVAEISVPASISAGGVLEVSWKGPGNREDFIEIVAAGADVNAGPLSEARTSQGSPLSLFAPADAGEYEVRYKMRDTGEVLASVPLRVQ